jgi:hypothetical protein
MLQCVRLLQSPKSCWPPLCLVCFDRKIKKKIERLWKTRSNWVRGA